MKLLLISLLSVLDMFFCVACNKIRCCNNDVSLDVRKQTCRGINLIYLFRLVRIWAPEFLVNIKEITTSRPNSVTNHHF